jgi:hypothetical protein
LRDGPSVRGSSKTSRVVSGAALKLLVSSRGLATGHTSESRTASGRGVPAEASHPFHNLRFENCLPINLRAFLATELGGRVCIDDSVIAPSVGEFPEAFMRDLARAIRRFSFERAHETWIEVVVSPHALEEALTRARTGAGQMVLCLGCARLCSGPDASCEHKDTLCVALMLNGFASRDYEPGQVLNSQLRRSLYREIDNFRLARERQGLPHYDLDYYMRDSHYVFTWRPLVSR